MKVDTRVRVVAGPYYPRCHDRPAKAAFAPPGPCLRIMVRISETEWVSAWVTKDEIEEVVEHGQTQGEREPLVHRGDERAAALVGSATSPGPPDPTEPGPFEPSAQRDPRAEG